jgi:hypothetical protein
MSERPSCSTEQRVNRLDADLRRKSSEDQPHTRSLAAKGISLDSNRRFVPQSRYEGSPADVLEI